MKTNCENIRNNLWQYLDQEPEPDFRQHLIACEECNRIYQQAKSAFDLIEREKHLEINPFLTGKIMERIQTKAPVPEMIPNHSWQTGLRMVLASFTLILGIGLGVYLGNPPVSGADGRSEQLNAFADAFYLDQEIETIENFEQ
ncbi:MAG: hypothetical protein ACNS62_05495 [Candidatus Cyclobacteriaceae bacterium M3_2C_046]